MEQGDINPAKFGRLLSQERPLNNFAFLPLPRTILYNE
jgi:hypothetical protein